MNLRFSFKNIVLAALLVSSMAHARPEAKWIVGGGLATVLTFYGIHQKAYKTTSLAWLGTAGYYFWLQNSYGNAPWETAKFAWEGMQVGNKVGTIFPCSKYLGQALVAKLPEPSQQVSRKYLETGAGSGTVSIEVLNKMGANDTLDLVELEESFCVMLREKFKDDKRVNVHCGSILDFNPGYTYDGVVTTIPFNECPPSLTKAIWQKSISLLSDGGAMSYVNYCFPPKLVPLAAKFGFMKELHRNMIETNKYLDALHAKSGNGFVIEKRNVPDIRIRYFTFDKQGKEAALALSAS